jgi:hypothetical protein
MSQRHERRDCKDTLVVTNGVEPGRIYDSCDVGKVKINTALCEILVQDSDLPVDLRIWDVTTLHGVVFGDDVDCVNPGDQLWVVSERMHALLQKTGMVICFAESRAEGSSEALSVLNSSSALAMLSGEITVPQRLETCKIEPSMGKGQ